MIKIWFLLMLISAPNMPSVKYQGYIFPTEEECMLARAGYHNNYELRDDEYKGRVVIDSFCLPFEAFPVKGMNYEGTKFGI